jgi:hypothetical protein
MFVPMSGTNIAPRHRRAAPVRTDGSRRYDPDVPRPDLDALDRRILELHLADARRSTTDIGRTIGLDTKTLIVLGSRSGGVR